jgi:hypothetical protein
VIDEGARAYAKNGWTMAAIVQDRNRYRGNCKTIATSLSEDLRSGAQK